MSIRRRRIDGRVALVVLAAALLPVLLSQPAWGQQETTTADTAEESARDEAADDLLEAIPTATIASRAESDLGKLREAENLTLPVAAIQKIALDLPAMRAGIQEADILLARLEASPGALRQLEDARIRWQAVDTRLTSWSERLTARTVALDATRQALISTGELWTRTRQALAPGEVPDALLARIDQVRSMAELRGGEIHQRLNEVLVLQTDIADLATQADSGLEQVERLLKQHREQVLAADAPPLWRLLGRQDAGAGLGQQMRSALSHDRQALQSFRIQAGHRPALHFLLACFFLALLFTLRHRSTKWDLPDADKQAAAHILGRPLSASLFLTLMATAFLYPQAPSIVFEINRILFLIPVLRLVPGLLGRASRRPLFMLAALYLADNLVDLALERTLLQRALLLVSTLAAMGTGLWIARRHLDGDLSRPAVWLQHQLTHLAILLLAISAVANVLGYVALANLLTNGTLTSAYGVFILFAATQVLGVLISVLLHSRLAGLVRSLSRDVGLVRRNAGKLLDVMAILTWVGGTLYFFGLLGMVWNGLTRLLAHQWSLGSLQISLGSILAFIVAIWISVLISRLIRFVLMEDVMPRLPLARGMPSSIAQLVHYAIISLGFLAALGAAGIELSKFAILAGALGVGIGFGLQSLVNNFVSGLILIFERPMQIGDKIEVGVHRGEVRRIGFRASTIRTFAGAEIIVPNGDLISKELTNWTLSDHMRRVDVPVGVAYGSDPEQVIQILKDVADRESDALKRPEPKAHFMEFGDSSLNFMLRFWTPKFDEWWGVHSRMTLGIHQALKEAGVTIPFPQRDLHLRSVDGEAAGLLARRTGGKDTTD